MSQIHTGQYQEVIVENHGEPMVAIIAVKELELMKKFREQEKRKKALEMLRGVRERVQARIKGKLTSKQVQVIANRFSREIVEDMEKEGKIRFERTSR